MFRKRTLHRFKNHTHNAMNYISIAFAVFMVGYVGVCFSPIMDWADAEEAPESQTESAPTVVSNSSFQLALETFAEENDLQMNQWPDELLEAAERNPEMEDFVLNYPIKKDETPEIDLDDCRGTDTVPLLFQWDERWGYSEYSGGPMGLTGCGPTCLSMVCIYLLNDPDYNPRYIAEFSRNNGYSVTGSGSAWALISEGGEMLGLDVTEIPLDEERIIRNLEAGNPIICVMGPGDFTTTGHFIVMTDYVDGMIKVNDPNSNSRSEQLWDYARIKDQILNLWVCR